MTNYNYLPRTSLKVGGIVFKSQNKRSYVLKELSDFLYYNNCYKTFKEELQTQFGILNNEEVTVGSLEDYSYQEMPPHENLIYFVIEHNYTRSVISVDLDGIIKIHHIGEIDFQHDISFDSPDLTASFDKWKNANGFSDININDILLRLGIVDDIDLTLESSSFTAASYFNKDISEASFCFYRKAFTWETCDHMYSKTGHNIIFINNYIVVFDSVSWLYENPTKPKIYKVTRNKMGRLKIKRSYFPPFRILRTSNNYVSHVMSDGTLDIDLRRPYCSPNIKPGPVGSNKYSEIFFRGLYLAFPENCVWERKLKDKNDLFEVPNDQEVKRYLESIDPEKTSILEILKSIQELTGCYIDFTGSINMTCKNPSGFETNLAIVHDDKDYARTFKLNDINGYKKSGRIECDTYLGYTKGTPMNGEAVVEYFVPERIGVNGIKIPGISLKYIFEGTEALDIPEELDITNYFLNLPYMSKNDYQYIWGEIGLKIVLANPGCTKVTRTLEVDGHLIERIVHNKQELDDVRELHRKRSIRP